MTVRVLGIRHHSPACARLVAHTIAAENPFAVLIEGPSDFNHRIGELLLDHTLPVALYSYTNSDDGPRQCWFPFLEYSPEWVALRCAHAAGALTRFIDLPHWQYRTLSDARKRIASVTRGQDDSRYSQVMARLCRQFGCDGDNALWDRLFESLCAPHTRDELRKRLDLYCDELRADDPGTEQDQARERYMAQWVAWAQQQSVELASDGLVLVICGGWHKRAIEKTWPALASADEPVMQAPTDTRQAGSYLIPYEYRQVDALGGYWSGMQSPLYYQWVWQHGLSEAAQRAVRHIVARLRQKKVALSTADFVAFERTLTGLAHLRGNPVALRTDILDAMQSAVIKEALETPSPWISQGLLTSQHHPALREALLALTGEVTGKLHADTPMPPLLHDVTRRLEECGLRLTRMPQSLVLDRRREADSARAHVLWMLSLLGVEGVKLTDTRAPNAARNLSAGLRFEEHWSAAQDDRWFVNLIEASSYGATLDAAARNRLLERMHEAQGDPGKLAQCMLHALRAGFADMSVSLAEQLQRDLVQVHDHAALAQSAHVLLDVVQIGFWGADTHALMERTLAVIAERILWLLETHDTAKPSEVAGDVSALSVFDALLRMSIRDFDARFALETLTRFARSAHKPPAVRGAALAVSYVHDGLGRTPADEILAITRSIPPRDALGDFLYGLFSCARALATESESIVQAVQGALDSMSAEDFLVALPQLRGAFSWFPPRERAAIAVQVARMLNLSGAGRSQLLSLRQGTAALVDARHVEAQALEWARSLGVLA